MSIPKESIVSGTRDYIRYFENPNLSLDKNAFFKLDEVIDWMISDDPKRKVTAQNGQVVNYYPTKKFYIPVDRKAVLAAERVPLRDSSRIVNRIEWNIGKGGLYKGDLVVLDIIASNAKEGWKRPIYWTTTTGSSVFLKLDNYLRHNGLTYELIPVRQQNRQLRGMDDMDLLYDKLMNVYEWGNMDKGTLFLDDKATLLPKNLRSLFVQVGDNFSRAGKHDSAVALINRCYEAMPESILPMDLRLKTFSAEVYYRAGQNEEGDRLLDEVGADAVELVNYYKRFTKRDHYRFTAEYLRDNLSSVGDVIRVAKDHKRDDLAKKYEALYNQIQVGIN